MRPSSTPPSRREQHLAGRLATLERPMRLGRVLERKRELHPELELAVSHPGQPLAGGLQQLLASGRVVAEAGPRQEERALGVEDLRIDLPDGAARLTVERDQPPRSQAVEALVPRGLAHRVVDHLYALAVG